MPAQRCSGVRSSICYHRAIGLVRQIARRPDADVPIILEANETSAVIGSLAEHAADVLRELRQISDLDVVDIAPAGFVEIPSDSGMPDSTSAVFAVPMAGSVDDPFRYQNGYAGSSVYNRFLGALSAASRAAAAEHIGLIDVLRRTCRPAR